MAYATREELELLFGKSNVEKWADLENEEDAGHITTRIDRAIKHADNRVDSMLRRSRFRVPLSPVPDVIVDIATRLAGVWLYESRGVQDWNEETGRPAHKLQWHKQEAERVLRAIQAGQIDLESGRFGVRTSSPTVVKGT